MRLKKLNSEKITIDKKLLNLNNRHFFLLDGLFFCLTPFLAMVLRLDDLSAIAGFYKGLTVATNRIHDC